MTPLDERRLALDIFPNGFKDAHAFDRSALGGSMELIEKKCLINITVQFSESVGALIVDDLFGPVAVDFVDLIRFVRRLDQV